MAIPLSLKPKHKYNLFRVGSKNDGGYLVEKESIFNCDFLLSFGVSTDWNFEKEFINLNSIKFKAYDGSINELFWMNWKNKAIYKSLRLSFKELFRYYKIKKSFKKFFNKNNFESKYIGNKKKYLSVNEIIKDLKFKNIFLKIDIEGSEYEILNDLIKFQRNMVGLAIEFHKCDKMLNKIIEFNNKLDLEIVHIHGNNYDSISKYGIPKTLEITFSKLPKPIDQNPEIPHFLDAPNKHNKKELKLEFGS
jgi:hypothetical protein